jgi:hypothetical protein
LEGNMDEGRTKLWYERGEGESREGRGMGGSSCRNRQGRAKGGGSVEVQEWKMECRQDEERGGMRRRAESRELACEQPSELEGGVKGGKTEKDGDGWEWGAENVSSVVACPDGGGETGAGLG